MGAEVVLVLELGTACDGDHGRGRRAPRAGVDVCAHRLRGRALPELACARGADPVLVVQELPAGRYFVFLEQGFVAAAMARSGGRGGAAHHRRVQRRGGQRRRWPGGSG
ncbi:MAG: hypothetical protein R3F43_18155 [bacterium]